MATATISPVNYPKTIIFNKYGYPISIISNLQGRNVLIDKTLPFRVRFTNIGIGGPQDGLVPPIGIAIVGVNNYIL